MNPVNLARLATDGVAFDTETHRIRAGMPSPPLVCASLGWLENGQINGKLLDETSAMSAYYALLTDPSKPILELANAPFDLLVMAVRFARGGVDIMPETFAALLDERIFDIQIAEPLDAIAEGCLNRDPRNGGELINPETGRRGRYSLATLVDIVLGRTDAKANDDWRAYYEELHPFAIETWPETARVYPVDDARNTHEVALAQAGFLPRAGAHRWGLSPVCEWCGLAAAETVDASGNIMPCRVRRRSRNIHDLSNQVCTDFVMRAGAAWGFKVDQTAVDAVEDDSREGREAGTEPLIEAGLMRRDKKGKVSKDTSKIAERVALAYGADPNAKCDVCKGTRKVPSPKNPKSQINCTACGATGLDLSQCPNIPTTPTERISGSRDTLNEAGDDVLIALADHLEDAKTLQTYTPFLRRARMPIAGHGELCPARTDEKENCVCPGPYRDIPLTLWPNVLLETGRTSYSGVIHQFPRKPGHFKKLADGSRGPWVPSLRECVVARDGCVFSSEDFEAGELVTHGQSCLWICGESELARALNAGMKVHNALGASMIGMTYDDFQAHVKEKHCSDARQAAKPGNFGFPGGMGPVKMVQTQRRQGPDTPCPNGPTWIEDENGNAVRGYRGLRFCILMNGATSCGSTKRYEWHDKPIAPTCAECIDCAVRLKETWLSQWPENDDYFEFINDCINFGMVISAQMLEMWPWLQGVYTPGQQLAPGEVMQHVSGRIRQLNTETKESPYCAGANGFFQALLADAAKSALRRVGHECYDRTIIVPDMAHENSLRSAYAGIPSPLFGSHVIAFQHDELLCEHPESIAHDAAMRVSEIMRDELRYYCPDLAAACKAEPTLMRRWFKGAKPRWLHGGDKPANQNDRLIPWERAA